MANTKIYTVVKDGEELEKLKTLTAAKKLADAEGAEVYSDGKCVYQGTVSPAEEKVKEKVEEQMQQNLQDLNKLLIQQEQMLELQLKIFTHTIRKDNTVQRQKNLQENLLLLHLNFQLMLMEKERRNLLLLLQIQTKI